MCRLLGYVTTEPLSLHALLGDTQLEMFRALSCLHGDGWGTSWLAPDRPDGPLLSARSTLAAADDPGFDQVAERTGARARIVHLRWATAGYPVDEVNTHPFSADGMSFAHNGSIAPIEPLDGLLSPSTRAGLLGDTDSERYFALVRQKLAERPGDVTLAAVRAASDLRVLYPDASLNALLLTPAQLIVVHANSALASPSAESVSIPGGAPLDHVTAYFLMRWLRTADGSLVFASSGMEASDWTPLPEESVTTVDLKTLQLRHTPIAEPVAAGVLG